MIRFATDQDFNARIVTGLRRRVPEVDVVSVRDVGLARAPDPEVLEWAAREQRVLLSHDVNTVVGFAAERLRRGDHHAGLVKVPQTLAIGRAIEDLVLVTKAASAEDLRDRTIHLPL